MLSRTVRFGESTILPLTRQFSERLGLDWKRRARLLVSRQARLPQLVKHDEGMTSRMNGLRCLGEPGLRNVHARLREEIVPRDLFSLTIQSCVTGNADCFMACVALAEAMPHLQGAFLAAMEWVEPAQLHELMKGWRTNSELHRLTKLRLLADVQFDSLNLGSVIDEIRTQTEQRLLLRAARVRARPDQIRIPLEENVATLSDNEFQWEVCAHHLLFGGVQKRDQMLEQACDYIQYSKEKEIKPWIILLVSEPAQRGERLAQTILRYTGMGRYYIIALGWLGKVQYIPELIDLLDKPALARIAAHSITMLTGSMPEKDDWQRVASNTASTDKTQTKDQHDPDGHLPWPDKKRFSFWWNKHRQGFDTGSRYLLGNKREPQKLVYLLREAPLIWRPAAAWMLQRQRPAMALDTDAAVFRQIINLARLERLAESTV